MAKLFLYFFSYYSVVWVHNRKIYQKLTLFFVQSIDFVDKNNLILWFEIEK